jgi:hypothetical protein
MNKATELIRLKVKDKNERAAKSRDHKLVNGGGHAHLSQMRWAKFTNLLQIPARPLKNLGVFSIETTSNKP